MAERDSNGPVTPTGINHIVLNVRDIEESHTFWTEVVGFKQVGELKRPGTQVKMRFYSGDHNGEMNHHDIALVENPALPPPPPDRKTPGNPSAVNHVAVTLADRESWLRALVHVRDKGVEFKRRVNHGMTHSLYISDPNGYGVELLYELPREFWGGDIDAALNYAENLPTEGDEAFEDTTEVPTF